MKSNQNQNSIWSFTLRQFRDGMIAVLDEVRTPVIFAYSFLFLRFVIFIVALIDFELLNLPPSQLEIVKYIYYLLPYKLHYEISTTLFVIINACLFTLNSLIIVGFLLFKRIRHKIILRCFGIFIYFYIYVGINLLIGNIFYIYKAPISLNLSIALTIYSLNTINIIYTLLVIMALFLFFVNTFLKHKDSLSKDLKLSSTSIFVLYLLMILADVFSELIGSRTKSFLGLFLSCYQLYIFGFDITYDYFSVSMIHLLLIFFEFYTSILYLCVSFTLNSYTNNNFFVLVAVGYVLFVIDFYFGRNFIFRKILMLDSQRYQNPSYFDKKIRYMIQLIKSSESQDDDELTLITLVFLHTKNCKELDCICKNRSSAWDPKKAKFADSNLSMWKDKIFLKSLNYSIIQEFRSRNSKCIHTDYLLIVYSLEVLGNTVKADCEAKCFRLTYNSFLNQLVYYIPLMRISKKIEFFVNKKAEEFPFARNQFEKVIESDKLIHQLKLIN